MNATIRSKPSFSQSPICYQNLPLNKLVFAKDYFTNTRAFLMTMSKNSFILRLIKLWLFLNRFKPFSRSQ